MDTPESGNKFAAYVRANRAFFVFLAVIVLSVFGYFWWRSGFTLEFSKFFAYCGQNGCDMHLVCVSDSCQERPDPNGVGDLCSSDEECGGGGPACTPSCADGDCDGDCAKNPAVPGGNDCDDGNPNVQGNCPLALCGVDPACQGNENQNNCPQDCGSPGPTCGDGACNGGENQTSCSADCGSPTYTCTQNGGFCPGGGCPPGTVSAGGTCASGQCCRSQATPPAPTINTFDANPSTVRQGQTTTLTWASNGTNCAPVSGAGFETGGQPSGTDVSAPFDLSSVANGAQIGFAIDCSGPGGTTRRTLTVTADKTSSGPFCGDNTCDTAAPAESCTSCPSDCGECSGGQHLACQNSSCAFVPGNGSPQDGCTAPGQSCTGAPQNNPCNGVSDKWTENGVTVCLIRSSFNSDRCTPNAGGRTLTYTVGIFNQSGGPIYSKAALFYCPSRPAQDACGALDNNSYPGCGFTGVDVSGATSLGNGDGNAGNLTTYTMTVPDCGSFQLDDTWRGQTNVFVIGKVIESGRNCSTPATHNVCQNNACVSVPGGGADQCSSAADCAPVTHNVCQNNACVSVAGAGAQQCASAADCSHLTCVSNACTRVSGGGANTCTPENSACTHLECISSACTRVAGLGSDLCTPEGAVCGVVPTHLECISNACTRVNGAGTDACSPQGSACGITTPPLECVASVTQAAVGELVPFSASGGTGSYSWYGPGGTPSTIGGPAYQPSYGIPGFKTVTVVSGGNQATCTVTIVAPQTSTPPPTTIIPPTTTVVPTCTPVVCQTPSNGCTYQGGTACSCGTLVCPSNAPLVCAPLSQEVSIGQTANFVVGGGTVNTYSWTATGGNPPSASGPSQSFKTEYSSAGTYRVTVSGGGQTDTCNVLVRTSTITPTPTDTTLPIPSSPAITIAKTVRNVTANGPDTESADAEPGHTVEFTIRVSSNGSGTARDVTLRDALPAGLIYQGGTTRVDGAVAADGITGSGILLGDMASGRTIVVRFRAIVADPAFFTNGTTTLVNTAFARGSNTGEVSDLAQVVVTRGQGLAISITKLGRNVTRGESGEHSPVQSSPGQTIEFFIHVRNTSTATLTNVVVRDVLPARITFIPGTVRLNGQPAADTLGTSGVPIGNLNAGAEAVITFSGRVAADAEFAAGSVTLINTAQATADAVPMVQAQLPVIVTKGAVVTVPTGPGESTLLALIISALITLLYVGYTSTESFRRREAAGLAGQPHDKGLFDFKR